MQEGTIASLTTKGFGFIKRDGEQKDLFFHSADVTNASFDDLREGDKLSFEVEESDRGPRAVKVTKI